MSSSVRRIKERGGAGGKITASKPQNAATPNAQKDTGGGRSYKKAAGKENPRVLSGKRIPAVSRKPDIRLLPLQGPGKEVEPRVRWSTSSLPKGKKFEPSDFARFLSDRRNERLSKDSDLGVPNGPNVVNGTRVLERCQQKKILSKPEDANDKSLNASRVLDDCKREPYLELKSMEADERVSNCVRVFDSGLEKTGENVLNGSRVLDICKEKARFDSYAEQTGGKVTENSEGEVNLNANMEALEVKDVNIDRMVGSCVDNGSLNSNLKVLGEKSMNGIRGSEKCKDRVCLELNSRGAGENSRGAGEKVLNSSKKNFEYPKEMKADEEDTKGSNRYASKLHEKLAFLEGKVKRIASDIKRTKEMLDLNNPDASKLILSDIQDKISGIEIVMGRVIDDSKSKFGLSEIVKNADFQAKPVGESQDLLVGNLKSSVKGLDGEELEARLFPHHKLLRNRTLLGVSVGKDENDPSKVPESDGDLVPENGSLSPIDENPIAIEFLASLSTDQSKINTNNRHTILQCPAINGTDSDNGTATSTVSEISKKVVDGNYKEDLRLTTDEKLEDFDDQENRIAMIIKEETEDSSIDQLREIGRKSSTGGWFVSEGESVLLAHDDGSCSFYDITNSEEKAEYKPPAGVSHNLWGDCWLIRATGSDGCTGRYVVAASAGNTLDSGFCSWDFYTKDIRAFRVENGTTNSSSRTVLGPLPNTGVHGRNALSAILCPENQQWWYKPCGPLLVSTASCQRVVSVYDIRDGDLVMKWEVQRPVMMMDYSSPLQWRNKGKVVIAETEAISLWDVNSLNPQSLLSIPSFGKRISALHVNNSDAELGGGVRQRVSSSEAEGNEGVFCTQESINVLDFRLPSGVGLKIPKHGLNNLSVFSRGDSIFLGGTDTRPAAKKHSCSQIQHFSLRKGKLVSTYSLPESNAHIHHSSISQVWGNSNLVMGICGLGLFVFDTDKDESTSFSHGNTREAREIIGPDDLYCPSFDYLASRILLISRDRPALWRYLS